LSGPREVLQGHSESRAGPVQSRTVRKELQTNTKKEHVVPTPDFSASNRTTLVTHNGFRGLIALALVLAASSACDDPVPPPEPTSITLNLTELTFTAEGETSQLTAQVYDQNGQLMAGQTVAWSTNAGTVASVDQTGLVRAEGAGTARITATAGTASASAAVTVVLDPDRMALIALYDAAGGEGWGNNGQWLSEAPLGSWFGVETDADGRVTGLNLRSNGLAGTLPPEIGNLTELRELRLHYNHLSGTIPSELGNLTRLRELLLYQNGFSGTVPPVLGDLTELIELDLSYNDLSGTIPSELGNLVQLRELFLEYSGVAGAIPPEIGNLTALTLLWLQGNELSGSIPPELGNLTNLVTLRLHDNELTGSIPGEIGGLTNLEWIHIHNNRLSGELPDEFGSLVSLTDVWMGGNDFSGSFPVVLTHLPNIETLVLAGNRHTGALPDEIGDMANLARLLLTDTDLSGLLPAGMTRLERLSELMLQGTGLCAPEDDGFQAWLEGVTKRRIPSCEDPGEGSVAYLTQAVQSVEYPVPLVAGEEALLRVFVVAPAAAGDTIPKVRATFHVDGQEAEVVVIERGTSIIGDRMNEGSLSSSANARIPASVIQPGLEMVVEIDPDQTVAPELGVTQRIPETGRMAVNVRAMPDLELTLIPFLWSENPDSAILEITGDMSPGDPLLRDIRDLLPVAEIDLHIHEPVMTNSNNAFSMLDQTGAIRAAEGGTGYFMGTLTGAVTGAYGVAYVPGWTSFSIADSSVMAHELGHNLSLYHAPCGGAGRPDISFPQSDGTIGAWGYDFSAGSLVQPSVRDLMSYCSPTWISEFYFTNSLRHRLVWEAAEGSATPAAPTLSLLITGGVGENGSPYLGPAFVIDAPPSLPRSGGAYRLRGVTAAGAELFGLGFEMPVIAGQEDRSSFAFTVPAQAGWARDLARITLAGPNGSVTLDADTDRPAVILRDPRTGQVRGFFTDLPPGATVADARGGLVPVQPGLEVLFTRGIPDAAAWRR
jgi:Leucine-rich repeat (LRR) protein